MVTHLPFHIIDLTKMCVCYMLALYLSFSFGVFPNLKKGLFFMRYVLNRREPIAGT